MRWTRRKPHWQSLRYSVQRLTTPCSVSHSALQLAACAVLRRPGPAGLQEVCRSDLSALCISVLALASILSRPVHRTLAAPSPPTCCTASSVSWTTSQSSVPCQAPARASRRHLLHLMPCAPHVEMPTPSRLIDSLSRVCPPSPPPPADSEKKPHCLASIQCLGQWPPPGAFYPLLNGTAESGDSNTAAGPPPPPPARKLCHILAENLSGGPGVRAHESGPSPVRSLTFF